jgi:hypothetical protein
MVGHMERCDGDRSSFITSIISGQHKREKQTLNSLGFYLWQHILIFTVRRCSIRHFSQDRTNEAENGFRALVREVRWNAQVVIIMYVETVGLE